MEITNKRLAELYYSTVSRGWAYMPIRAKIRDAPEDIREFYYTHRTIDGFSGGKYFGEKTKVILELLLSQGFKAAHKYFKDERREIRKQQGEASQKKWSMQSPIEEEPMEGKHYRQREALDERFDDYRSESWYGVGHELNSFVDE